MTIREAKPEDASAMARVRVDTWRAAYRGIVPDVTLDNLSYETTAKLLRRILWEENQGEFGFVAESQGGQVVGIAVAGPVFTDKNAGFKGEVYILYVLPDFQNQGLGGALMKACAKRLAQLSLTPFMLWTYAQGSARDFYERLGGVKVREKEDEQDGKRLMSVAYGWSNMELLQM